MARTLRHFVLTLLRCSSMPGRIMMMDTNVPSSSRKEKASRLMVELYVEGQHDDKRQEAEPHRQDAWRRNDGGITRIFKQFHVFSFFNSEGALGCGTIRLTHARLVQTVVGRKDKTNRASAAKRTTSVFGPQAYRRVIYSGCNQACDYSCHQNKSLLFIRRCKPDHTGLLHDSDVGCREVCARHWGRHCSCDQPSFY